MPNYVVDSEVKITIQVIPEKTKRVSPLPTAETPKVIILKDAVTVVPETLHEGEPPEYATVTVPVKNEGASGRGFLEVDNMSNFDIDLIAPMQEETTVKSGEGYRIIFNILRGEVKNIVFKVKPVWNEIEHKAEINLIVKSGYVSSS